MNKTQQKAFIDKLRTQLQGNSNKEYNNFLNECISSYNSSTSDIPDLDIPDLDIPTNDISEMIADPSKRLIAHIIDVVFFLHVPLTISLGILYLIIYLTDNLAANPYVRSPILVLSFIFVFPVVTILVNSFFWKKSKSIGKIVMKITVVDKNNKPIKYFPMLLRETLGKLISGLIFGLGYLWLLWDTNNQCWHDKFSNTYVTVDKKNK